MVCDGVVVVDATTHVVQAANLVLRRKLCQVLADCGRELGRVDDGVHEVLRAEGNRFVTQLNHSGTAFSADAPVVVFCRELETRTTREPQPDVNYEHLNNNTDGGTEDAAP